MYTDSPVVGVGANGVPSLYYIDPATGTCKKASRNITERFAQPEDLSGLDAQSAKLNTKILHDFLNANEVHATYAGTHKDLKVRACDYEFQYTVNGFGFDCRDMRNGWQRVDLGDVGDELPTPEAVLRFINRHKDRPAMMHGETLVLGSDQRVVRSGDRVEVVTLTAKPAVRENLEDALDRIFEGLRAKTYTLAEANKELQKYIDNPSHKNRVGRAFKRCGNIDIVYDEVRAILGEEHKVKAPKFEYFEFPYDRLTRVVFAEATNEVEYSFQRVDRKGSVTEKRPLHGFLWRVALHLNPKAMQYMMKIADGTMKYDPVHPPRNYQHKDLYQDFDRNTLDNPTDPAALEQLCDDIIAWAGEPDPTQVCYAEDQPDYTKGTKVLVYWPDYRDWFFGEVIETDFGIVIRYEDGDTYLLMKHNRVRVLGKK